jgi:FkbM family methyltransferase
MDLPARARLTQQCRDADAIPRVAKAGKVETDPETGARIQYMHNGLRVLAGGYYGDWMTDLIEGLQGVHEPQEEIVFHGLLPRIPADATMVEIGAFWSYYTLWFMSEHKGSRRGLGLEMDPAHIEVGRKNAALNGLEMEFVQGRIGARDTLAEEFDTESSGRQSMPTYGLEGLLAKGNIEKVDVLLCDAQGGEIAMLSGMQSLVDQGRVGVLVMSTHHHQITGDPLTHQRALHLIKGLGGKVYLEHDVSESYSGDGLIVADFGTTLEGWTAPEISRCRASDSLFRNTLYDLAEALGQSADPKPAHTRPATPSTPDTDGAAPESGRFDSYAQNFEDVMLWRALKHVKNGFYVDVGAAWPDEHSVTRAFYSRGWRGINVDPNPEYYAALRAQRPEDTNLGIGIGAKSETRMLYKFPETGLSTFDAKIAQEHKEKGWRYEEVPLTLRSLADVFGEHVRKGQDIHFLKVDVEGWEADVLEGADWKNWRPWIVLVEATEPLKTTVNHEQWERSLLDADYDFVYFDGLNRFYVAKEKNELKSAFSSPPNCFDEFALPAQRQLEDARAEADRLLTEVKRRDEVLERRVSELKNMRAQVETLQEEMFGTFSAYLKRRRDTLARSIRKRFGGGSS